MLIYKFINGYTIYCGLDNDGIVFYNTSNKSNSGYYNLNSLLKLKGLL